MVLISIILFLCPNWNCNGSEQKRIEILNLVDTINYWHVLIDGEVQLKANHHLEDSELLINIDRKQIPEYLEIDYRTDHGFEYSVDRIIELKNSENQVLIEFPFSPTTLGETSQLKIRELLEIEEKLLVTLKFYISQNGLDRNKGYRNKREYEEFLNLKEAKSFTICQLILNE